MLLTILLLVLAGMLLVLLLIAAIRPDTFRIERSVSVAASPAVLFPYLNDLKLAQDWSPWIEIDPETKYTFSHPPSGVGANMTWAGNKKAGEGAQTIVESVTNEQVRTQVDFKKPFVSTSMTAYTLKTSGAQTVVTWTMTGKNNFFFRFMCMFMNQDRMIGGHFEKGLEKLKVIAERTTGK